MLFHGVLPLKEWSGSWCLVHALFGSDTSAAKVSVTKFIDSSINSSEIRIQNY